ncbi:UNVERIFIED_CONTAM: hypothetical protein FKN15_011996 [Acipenser sinensis]
MISGSETAAGVGRLRTSSPFFKASSSPLLGKAEPAGIHPLLVEVAEAEAALAALLLEVVEAEAAPAALLLAVEAEAAPAALLLAVEAEAAPAALLLAVEAEAAPVEVAEAEAAPAALLLVEAFEVVEAEAAPAALLQVVKAEAALLLEHKREKQEQACRSHAPLEPFLSISPASCTLTAFIIMIILALLRIGKGQGEGHPPAAKMMGIPNLFGVCVYSFMCQHSLPSLITPISNKKKVSRLVLLDYILILAFYSLLSFTAIFCFNNSFLKDMYTLNFTDNCDVINVAFLRYFLGLFPVFTISTNFPIIAVTLCNNWKTLFHREGGTYPWVVDRVVFPLITLVPPIIVAFCTHDLETLVGVTGAYAGTGIQYIIPACLVFFSRKDLGLIFGDRVLNKHRSPFHHTFWVWFILLWSVFCLMFVTANIILTETKH